MPRDDWRVITVKQPWAQAIAEGAKTVENRSRGHSWRGPIAIHAGKAWSDRGEADPRVLRSIGAAAGWEASRSAVIAVARLVDVHEDHGCCRPWGESDYHDTMSDREVKVVHHYVLEGIVKLEDPVAARGALGLWRPDPDLAAELDLLAS